MNEYNDIQGLDDSIPDWTDDQPERLNDAQNNNNACNTGASDTSVSPENNEPIGKCPHCGGDIIYGQYGAYCKNKCGMSIGKVYSRLLTREEAKQLLTDERVYLSGMVSKKDKEYSAYFIPDGIEKYSYTNKDGQLISGQYRYKFKLEFPKADTEK